VNGGANSSMEPLRMFRDRFYADLGRRADALFELCDAILTAGRVPSPPHLSLVSLHRRGWGSLYAALSKGRIDSEALRDLLASYDLGTMGTPVYAVDVSPWPRCDAESSPGRGYLYHPSRHSAGQPIVAGWAYQLVARMGFAHDSWVAPVDARRVQVRPGAPRTCQHHAHPRHLLPRPAWCGQCRSLRHGRCARLADPKVRQTPGCSTVVVKSPQHSTGGLLALSRFTCKTAYS